MMLLDAARDAVRDLLTPPLRGAFWKMLAATLVLLALAFALLERLIGEVSLPYAWMSTALSVLVGAGFLVGLVYLLAPVSSLVAGLFLDEVAEAVERERYPQAPVGRSVPVGRSIWLAVRFTLLVILVNAAALLLLLVPGLSAVAFLLANGYLLGREYFELAAMRYRSPADAREVRRRNALTILLGGFIIAGVLAVPIVNLVTPLFATAFMAHLHKRISGERPVPAGAGGRA